MPWGPSTHRPDFLPKRVTWKRRTDRVMVQGKFAPGQRGFAYGARAAHASWGLPRHQPAIGKERNGRAFGV
jgi:hypothetical protein